MLYFTYMTQSDSGLYYVGRHCTNNVNDGYRGSGVWVKKCKANGVNLQTSILEYYDNMEDLKVAEQKLLDEHFGKPECMNFNNRATGFGVGDANPARTPSERKRRSEHNWSKTEEGRQFLSENNVSKRDDVKVKRSDYLKSQWKDDSYRDKHSGDNHHMRTDEHRTRMSENNPMYTDECREKASQNVKRHMAAGTWNLDRPEVREKARQNNPLRNGRNPMHDPEITALFKKPKERVKCPYCDVEGGKPVMMRYHFDKCKNAPKP